jgi:large subunit ribosomal protein L9
LAVQATPQSENVMLEKKAKKERDEKKSMKEAGKLSTQLDGLEVAVKAKVSEGGKLYAAVSAADVVGAVKEEGIKIDSEMVEFTEPIKETGSFEVIINLPHGFEAKLNVRVEEN